ncbi:hypothetical protein [Streptomyces sp. HUAS ZL42]|uniref:hypothetical protein n=1 Tax=Streptomyces sp. HUAS ZL42 TaxID=3231715 RepID=UPI00345E7264
MAASLNPLRHALLPDRERSYTVLVGSGYGLPNSEPEEVTLRLAADALAGRGGAFHPRNTTLLLGPKRQADVLDAVLRASKAASDVLLFQFAGKDFRREDELFLGVRDTDPQHLDDTGVQLAALTEIMSASQARRRVVILECGWPDLAASTVTRMLPDASLLAGPSSFEFTDDPFTQTLVQGLAGGVEQGPEALDLVTLKNAIEAAYAHTRYYVENEYIGAPSRVVLRGGTDVALGLNPAYGTQKPGSLPPHPDYVDQRESMD